MAKKTKDSNLSIEERLEQALIPNWDEPYKLPENWCWTTIKQVAEIVTGGTPSKKNPEYYGDSFPFFKPADLDAGRSVRVASEYLSEKGKAVARIIPAKSTAVCCIGSIGKSGYLEVDGTTNQQINSAIPKINPLYLYYYVNTDFFTNQLWQKSSATTISIVNKSKMEECTFPLCPTDEQQRIVDRIETLFAKLDEAKEKAQEVVDGFETRKAAILHKAFSGELTAKWREKNKDCEYKWEIKKLGEIVSVVKDKFDPLSNQNVNYPYIGLEHIQKGEGIKSFGVATDVKSIKGLFKKGDILYGKLRPYLDKHGIVDFDGVCSTDILIYRSTSSVVSSFVNYLFSTTDFINYSVAHSKGINLPRTSEKEISNYKLHLPDDDEIKVLVDNLDTLLMNEQQAKNIAEMVVEQIDIMKKAILARAFRGELGTNDPSEESALELLKRII